MSIWLRFFYRNDIKIGRQEGDRIHICSGELFHDPQPVGETCGLNDVEILYPCLPKKMLALWNNFYSRAEHEGWSIPAEPLYFVKTENSFNSHRQPIFRPASYDGPVFFEGELGIVIGKTCQAIDESRAVEHIFGYTCINDVTAKEILKRDPSFPQWTRAKGFDSFGVFGPGIATGLNVDEVVVETWLDGKRMQQSTVRDMVFHPYRLVSLISQDIRLEPGDIIACGTGLGAAPMHDGQTVEVRIDGIGCLQNTMHPVRS